MLPQTNERKRRYIYIENNLYKKVGQEAVVRETDNGSVIEEALKMYFSSTQKEN